MSVLNRDTRKPVSEMFDNIPRLEKLSAALKSHGIFTSGDLSKITHSKFQIITSTLFFNTQDELLVDQTMKDNGTEFLGGFDFHSLRY